MDEYSVGTKVRINNARVYGVWCNRSSYTVKSGEYIIYSDKIRNNRIRLTDDESKIGKPCMCTGWVNISDLILPNQYNSIGE